MAVQIVRKHKMSSFDGINNYTRPTAPYPSYSPYNPPPKKPKRKIWKWIFLLLLLAAVGGVVFGSNILSKTNQIFTGKVNIFTRFKQLIIADDKPLQGEEEGQVNILLLGMGGPGHDGPLLTDTMIVASINTKTNEVALVSIPRDFMVRLEGRGYSKINAAYAYAEGNDEGTGGQAAIGVAEQVTGLDIPYYASIDFKGFVKAVDTVGGLDVTVDRTFTDAEYPNYNQGYIPPITFQKGDHHFDGETALIFARSRHGNNGEGSDFARSERQKKIMLAFKGKVMGLGVTNLGTLNQLLSDFTENFRTNMEPYELVRLAKLGEKIEGQNVFSLSLEPNLTLICDGSFDLATGQPAPARVLAPAEDPDSEGSEDSTTPPTPTYLPDPEGVVRAYVVVPCSGKSHSDIHDYLKISIQLSNLKTEKAVIEVQNTTGQSWPLDPWRELARHGVEVKFTSSKTAIERTILYDNTKNTKPKTLQYLRTNFLLSQSDLPYTQSSADFVVILGKDALN
jgi:polyisoprenyl-teichoic acid--peptidoglycan teichoic acid transferase